MRPCHFYDPNANQSVRETTIDKVNRMSSVGEKSPLGSCDLIRPRA
jgi:hypothetical protein